MQAVLVPNIVEANGKTVRENNLALAHKIPLGTLVEVNINYSEHHGIRMYVCHHGRDCDGTPLYSLWPSNDISRYVDDVQGNDDYARIQRVYNMKAEHGFSDESLIVIKLPE